MRPIDADELKEIIKGNENFIDWQKEEIMCYIDCVDTVDRILALPDEIIQNYKQFENECIAKGFTFNSLIVAREKQILKPVETYGGNDDFYMLCPCCQNQIEDISECGFKYCPDCGQRLEWEESE